MILVVDDEESLCSLIKEILEGRGFEVETCLSVPEALSHLQKGKFELVICDINLQSGRGESVEKYMRLKNSPYEKTPFIYISGNDELLKALPTNSNRIGKPFSVDGLVEMVKRLLDTSSKEAEPKKVETKKPLHPDLEKILKGGN